MLSKLENDYFDNVSSKFGDLDEEQGKALKDEIHNTFSRLDVDALKKDPMGLLNNPTKQNELWEQVNSLIDYNNIPELSGENVVDVSVDDTTRVDSTATVKRGLNDINGKISTAGDATDSVDVGNANDDAVDVTDNKDKNRNNDENEIGG